MRKAHGGEASAKNAAAARATGDFVVVLDADDAFLPTRLEALAELAQLRPDLDILTTDAYLVVDGRRVRRNLVVAGGSRLRISAARSSSGTSSSDMRPYGASECSAQRLRRVDSLDDGLGPGYA